MVEATKERLIVTEVSWEEKPSNGYLLRELFALLLRDPEDLTDEDVPSRMLPEVGVDEEGGKT